MAKLKRSFFSIVPILAIFTAVFIFFGPNLALPGVAVTPTVGTNDLTDQQYPFRFYLSKSLRSKNLPLWDSRISAGFPLSAEGQIGAFYPLNLFLIFLSPIWAVNLNLILCLSLIGLFTYFYLTQLDLARLAALFGATVFCFSGFLLAHQVNLNILNVVTWFPLQCLLIEKIIKSARGSWQMARGKKNNVLPATRSVLLLGLTFTLQALAGHPEVFFYISLFLFGYVLVCKIRLVPFFLMAVFLGIALAAIQIFPTWELVRNSPRALGTASKINFPVKNLLSFVSPFYFWNPEITSHAFDQNGWPFYERYGYIGVIPLLLSVYAVFVYLKGIFVNQRANQKQALIVFFALNGTTALLFSFGKDTPFRFIFSLFPFNLFRAPARFLLLVDFSLAVLAAVGFESLGFRLRKFLPKKLTHHILSSVLYTLIFLAFFDLFYHGRQLYQVVPAHHWYQTPKVVKYLKKYAPNARIAHENYYFARKKTFLEKNALPQTLINLRNLLPGFNNLFYDLNVVTVAADYAGLKIANFNEMEADLVFNLPQYPTLNKVELPAVYFRLARLMGVTHLVFAKEITSDKIEKVYSVGFKTSQDPINVYRLKNPLPYAFVVYNAEFYPSDDLIKRKIVKGFDPEKTVLILGERPDLTSNKMGFRKAKVLKDKETRVEVEVEAENQGFLVLLNAFYPGWEAFVDGRKTPIFRANYAFWAIPVSRGFHRVIFSYKPKAFKAGVAVSAAALILFLGQIFLFRKHYQRIAKVKVKGNSAQKALLNSVVGKVG